MIPAYVLGLNVPGLAATRSLGRAGVPVVGFDFDRRMPGFQSRFCQARICPHPVHEPGALLDFLLAAGTVERPALISTSDEFLSFVATHRDALSSAYRFSLPPAELNGALVDKRAQYELAGRVGTRHPATFYPDSLADVRRIANELQYPAFVKPYSGHLWRERFEGESAKGLKVGSARELVQAFEKVYETGLRALVQSVVVGPPTNLLEVCAFIGADGAPIAVFADRKLRQYPVEFGVGTLNESITDPQLLEAGLRFLRAIGYRGFAAVEFKRDARDGELVLIELNPRLMLQNGLAADCGINFPLIEYLDATGEKAAVPSTYRVGLKWWNAPDDLKSFLSSRRRGEGSYWEWIRSWVGARSFATFAWDDPLPLVSWYAARLLRGAARALRKKVEGARSRGPFAFTGSTLRAIADR